MEQLMKCKVLITGAAGFVGKNLFYHLKELQKIEILPFLSTDSDSTLEKYIREADLIFHVAGVNRAEDNEEFNRINIGLTSKIVNFLEKKEKKTKIIFSSSIHAQQDTPYGVSKKEAEDIFIQYALASGDEVYIYRLPHLFGKWSKPYYNSVVATFCYQMARGKEVSIHDRNKELNLVYIDDLIAEWMKHLQEKPVDSHHFYAQVDPIYKITLGRLAETIKQLHHMRENKRMLDLSDPLTKHLYTTYLSFLPESNLAYDVQVHQDQRGILFELLKSKHFGQIFVSKTKEKIIRGNHYHHSKVEKFCLIQGEALIKLRSLYDHEVITYHVSDQHIQIVDIPPGYTHSIENIAPQEMIVLFWANEIFDPEAADTFWEEVE